MAKKNKQAATAAPSADADWLADRLTRFFDHPSREAAAETVSKLSDTTRAEVVAAIRAGEYAVARELLGE